VYIEEIRSRAVSVPLDIPIVSAIRQSERVELVVVDVVTHVGIVGQSYLQAFGVPQARAICNLLDYLGGVLKGENALFTLRCNQIMQRAINLLGPAGLATFALSGIDCALWDILGKVTQTPVEVLLGAAGDRCAAYNSAGLWLDPPGPELTEQTHMLLDQGFRAIKMRVGRPSVGQDIEAAQAIRSHIGPDCLLMIDANQAWGVSTAIAAGRELEAVQPFWLEEPVDHDDLAGHAEIARALTVPIATGENLYLPRGFQALIDAGGCDIVMPDVQRVGGVTGWMRVAALAEAHRLPIASHLFPEISIHLLAASPTAQILEYMPWAQPIMSEPLQIENGAALVPQRPGLGMVFNDAAIERYAID
jgi:L-alanine-DL-glutamate epimerase-like enolase superfamily enzyme